MKLILGIDPVAASRPRVSKKGWGYYVDPYKSFKKALEEEVRQSIPTDHVLIDTPMDVKVIVAVTRPTTSKLPFPKPDVDNYAKGVLDACNKRMWTDDWLIHTLVIEKVWVEGPGWILLEIHPE